MTRNAGVHRRLNLLALFCALAAACGTPNEADDPSKPESRVVGTETLDMALVPPEVNHSPGEEYFDENRDYNMVIGTDQTPGGRIWAAWVSGADGPEGYFVVASSDDRGQSWSKPRLVIDPSNHPSGLTRRTLVGNFWTDPKGRLWLFFDQSMGFFDGRSGSWYIRSDDPDAADPQWTKPERIWHGSTLQKPTVLSTGEWLLPISLWGRSRINLWSTEAIAGEPYFPNLDEDRKAWLFVSLDEGETWTKHGSVRFPFFNFDEHSVVERDDGRLWMTARTKEGIHESFSADRGKSWSTPVASSIKNTNSRHLMKRLSSGRILLVKNGPIDQDVGRKQLMAFVSEDEGVSWRGGLELESSDRQCSYPDGFQDQEGRIFVIYDHERSEAKEILMASFTEEDVLAGKIVDKESRLRMLVSKAGHP